MTLPHKIKSWFRALFAKRQLDLEMDEEMHAHIEMRTQANIAAGMNANEAWRAAMREFGWPDTVKETCREERGVRWLENMTQDACFALRMLRKNFGFAVAAVLTLALGIGLNTAMFKVINTLLLQPLKYPESKNLYCLLRTTTREQDDGHSPAGFYEIQKRSADFAQIAAVRGWGFTLSESNRLAEMVDAKRVSAGLFDILRIQPELGRAFLPEEDQPGRNAVIILSHTFWMAHYAGDPDVIGKSVRLDGAPVEIVGVLPQSAESSMAFRGSFIFRPLGLTSDDKANHTDGNYVIVGRYRSDVPAAATQARFATLAGQMAADHSDEDGGSGLRIVSLQSVGGGNQTRTITLMLLGLSGFVLLIACANLGNLLLARTVARSPEFTIRAALGASRLQLIRPLVAECLLLATLGGGGGILVSVWTNDWMVHSLGGSGDPMRFALDWRGLAFAGAASIFAALCCCIAPIWLIWQARLIEALKSGGRSFTGDRAHHHFRQGLIIGQFALALILLTGAAIFVRGLNRMTHRAAGWNPAPLLCGMIAAPNGNYPDPPRTMAFYSWLKENLAALPGVESVAISYDYPVTPFPGVRKYIVEGAELPVPGHEPTAVVNGITPEYFDTVGTHVRSGRAFNSTDRQDSLPVVIINETMAQALFPGKDAVGRRLAVAGEKPLRWLEIVGIAEDVQFVDATPMYDRFQLYQPLTQETWNFVAVTLRTVGSPEALTEPLRRTVAALDPDIAVVRLGTAQAQIERNTSDLRTIQQLLAAFALLGLFLAALGIYGVISHIVAQRTSEIGIRMALGAQVNHVIRLVVATGMRMALVGAGIGLLGAVALARFLHAIMPGLATDNSAAVIAAAVVLVAVALFACVFPARRAARVEPLNALRHE